MHSYCIALWALLLLSVVAPAQAHYYANQTDVVHTATVADSHLLLPEEVAVGGGVETEWGNCVAESNSLTLPDSADTLAIVPQKQATFGAGKQEQILLVQPKLQTFVPNPQRALWLALVVPGAGQIYNRKYWKLPIIYGGMLGCTYAFLWNQQTYLDYSQAYLDIMDSNPATNSFMNYFPQGYDISGRESQYQTIFKNRKDRFRRYRDLSVICFVGVYLLSVIDAYVDAQLSVFDITPDLSLHISPTSFSTNSQLGFSGNSAVGIGATLHF